MIEDILQGCLILLSVPPRKEFWPNEEDYEKAWDAWFETVRLLASLLVCTIAKRERELEPYERTRKRYDEVMELISGELPELLSWAKSYQERAIQSLITLQLQMEKGSPNGESSN